MLVELRPSERRDTLPNIILRAFNLFQTDIGGDNFTSNRRWRQRYFQDGSRPVIFDAIYESGFLPAFQSWISIGTSVWVNGEDRLPLCNVVLPLFRLNLQMPSERCKTRGPLASLLFLTSITSTFHI